jgi:alkylated DNA repair dioxygenase AlkB
MKHTRAEAPAQLCGPDIEVHYLPAVVPAAQATAWLQELLATIAWRQETVRVFGREYPAPRLTAWHGDAGVRYRYSGIEHVARPWTEPLQAIRALVQERCDATFNAVLLNQYRDGRDSVGWHSDNEACLGPHPVIASVSLGGDRRLRFRRRAGPETHELLLGHGSLMVMRGLTQRAWQHCLPRCARASARVNLTFRLVGSALGAGRVAFPGTARNNETP